MKDNFKAARKDLRKRPEIPKRIIAVNGCMYGRDKNPLKPHHDRDKVYYKYAGQDFWNFISEDDDLYREIIKPIDKEAKRKDERFKEAYNAKINEMTKDFIERFITDNQIDWIKLVDFVSKRS
jgi:site-specific DNA-methyltransferase (cytosine-N4-specific)